MGRAAQKRDALSQAVEGLARAEKKPRMQLALPEIALVRPNLEDGAAPVDHVRAVVQMQKQLRVQGLAQKEWEAKQEDHHISAMESIGEADLAAIVDGDCPTLKARPLEFLVSPTVRESLRVIDWKNIRVNERVMRALSAPLTLGHNAAIFKGLVSLWKHWHATIDATAADQIGPVRPKEPPCAEAGFCLCKHPRVVQLLLNVEKAVKRWLPAKGARAELSGAQYCLLLIGQRVVAPAPPEAWEDGIMPTVGGRVPAALPLWRPLPQPLARNCARAGRRHPLWISIGTTG